MLVNRNMLLRACGFAAALSLGLAASTVAHAQQVDGCALDRTNGLTVYGEAREVLFMPTEALREMPRVAAEASEHDGVTARFEGVTLRDVLTRASVPTDLDGDDFLRYVVAEAADGYKVLFSLLELETAQGAPPLLADLRNGTSLGAAHGPLRVVVPNDGGHGRWVRQVGCLRLGRARGMP